MMSTFDFMKEWTDLYNAKRSDPTHVNIDFTGGEPTTNPNFWKIAEYVKQHDGFNVGLTTNGTWPIKDTELVKKFIDGITISWHAEAHQTLKDRALENAVRISKAGIWLQVNVMLHCDYFEEAKEVCRFLKENNISYNPVPIGDGTSTSTGWFMDSDGAMRRTSHEYTQEQQEWFWNEVGVKNTASSSKQGTEVGRKCCGGRCLKGKVNNEWQPVKLVENKFKNWYCTVDWHFLHIDQETGNVYHHQTCQAKHGQTTGPIGNLADKNSMLCTLREKLVNPTPIICPNNRCGCGTCVPKAKYREDFEKIWGEIVSCQ